jgi:hypothetical protein
VPDGPEDVIQPPMARPSPTSENPEKILMLHPGPRPSLCS